MISCTGSPEENIGSVKPKQLATALLIFSNEYQTCGYGKRNNIYENQTLTIE